MADIHPTGASDRRFQPPLSRAMADILSARSGLAATQLDLFGQVVSDLATAIQQGHTCIGINDEQRAVLCCSRLVVADGPGPLVISGGNLYLGRHFRYEVQLAAKLTSLAATTFSHDDIDAILDARFARDLEADRLPREAARVALETGLCIIGGGPGTGKTATIVRIAGVLHDRYGAGLRIALAAPTGKAAMRMRESIGANLSRFELGPEVRALLPDEPVTLHRLLGLRRLSGRPAYRADNPLPYDVVLVDEASMIDLALLAKLAGALPPGARLIMLGDRNQLASVESGAVLADCMEVLTGNVVELTRSYRFNEAIGALCERIRQGDAAVVGELLGRPETAAVTVAGPHWSDTLAAPYARYMEAVQEVVGSGGYPRLFEEFRRFQVLCALRRGPFGVEEVNRRIEQWLASRGHALPRTFWYAGKPVMVTRNDYTLQLYNGDIGICLPEPESGGELAVWFETGDGSLRRILPIQLPLCEPAWAMTVHKSQGSEFARVCLVLPDEESPVLSRELLYTAVTRAREAVTLVLTESVCRTAVTARTARHGGLGRRLAAAVAT